MSAMRGMIRLNWLILFLEKSTISHSLSCNQKDQVFTTVDYKSDIRLTLATGFVHPGAVKAVNLDVM